MAQRLIGALFVLVGLGIIAMDTAVSLRCVVGPTSDLQCHAERRILGIIPVARLDVQAVIGARVEVTATVGAESNETYNVQRLVLRCRGGETPLTWFSRRSGAPHGTVFLELEPFDRVANDINQLAEYGTEGQVAEYRSFVWTPLLVGCGFFIFGILALWPWGRLVKHR